MNQYFTLILTAFLSVFFSSAIYLLDQRTRFGQLTYKKKQLMIGFIFGGLSILGTETGIDVGGALINVRDAAPLCAGLIFGGPAGIIAGLMGGIERYLAVYWGAGTFTREACSAATIMAGFLAAFLRKYMFDDKRPAWFFGPFLVAVTEVFHMLLVFAIHMDNVRTAFSVVQSCTIPMILLNSIGVWFSLAAISLLSARGIRGLKKEAWERNLTVIIQRWLLLCIIIVFIFSGFFTRIFLTRVADAKTSVLLSQNLEDVENDIREALHLNALSKTQRPSQQTKTMDSLPMEAKQYHTSEDTEYVPDDIHNIIRTAAHNRHVGENGYVVITNHNFDIISDNRSGAAATTPSPKTEVDTQTIFAAQKGKPFLLTVNGIDFRCMYNDVKGYYVFTLLPEAECQYDRNMAIYITIFMEVILFTFLFIIIYILIKKTVVNNIVKVNQTLSEITAGNLDAEVDVRDNEEFAMLSHDINSTVGTLKRYIEEAKNRINQELNYARTIQYTSLPHVFPPFPDRKEFEIWAGMTTAKEVGGDFYDFYFVEKDKLAFLVADVSGKGIPAALFMMKAKTMIKNLASTGMKVHDVFSQANDRLCEDNEAEMFVTAWMGILDTKTGIVTYANAGHNDPLVLRPIEENVPIKEGPIKNDPDKNPSSGNDPDRSYPGKKRAFAYVPVRRNLVLGGMEGIPYLMHEMQLEKGDILFLYTDGVTEATNAANELYGDDRLKNCLNCIEHPEDMSTEEICKIVKEDVNAFVGEAAQFDDITMLCLRYQ